MFMVIYNLQTGAEAVTIIMPRLRLAQAADDPGSLRV